MQCPRCYYTNTGGSRVCDYCGARLDRGTDSVGDGGGAASSKRKTVLGPAPGAPVVPRPRENPAPRMDPKDPFRIAAEGTPGPEPVPVVPLASAPPQPPPVPIAEPPAPPPQPRARPTMIVGMETTPAAALAPLAGVALVVPPSGDPRSVILREGRTRLGRRPDLELVLEDPKVSTEHALIRIENGEAWMLDTSANGTIVAGRRCLNDRAVVTDGTVLRVGDTLIVLKLLSPECLAQLAADDA